MKCFLSSSTIFYKFEAEISIGKPKMNRIVKFFFGKPASRVSLSQTVLLDNCANCGAPLTGPYCSRCGQKKEGKSDFKVSHFLGETFHAFTHFDSKFFETVRNLFRKPGFLTLEYIQGHRKKYMNPIQLFFICNIIYFLFSTSDTFTSSLQHITEGPFRKNLDEMVDAKVKAQGINYQDYEIKFNERSKGEAKTLIILMIPIFAFMISLFFLGQKRYFVEHLVFSLHFFSFLLIFMVFGLQIILILIGLLMLLARVTRLISHDEAVAVIQFFNVDAGITALSAVFYFIYLFIAIKRVYAQSNVESSFKAFVFLFLIYATVKMYRNILFFSTFYGLRLSLH